MTVPSKGVLTFIFLAIMAVASTPLASAQEAMEGLNIVPVEPPKPCPKFTTANIVTLAKRIREADPEGIAPPPASTFLVMKEFEVFSLEQIKVARDFVIRAKGVATSGAEECEIDPTTGMCDDGGLMPPFAACNMWSEAKGRAFVDEAKAGGHDVLWVAENHMINSPLAEIANHWDAKAAE